MTHDDGPALPGGVTYEYRCRCGNHHQQRHRMGEAPDTTTCPQCVEPTAKRVFAMPAVKIDNDSNFFWREDQRRQSDKIRRRVEANQRLARTQPDAAVWNPDELQGFGKLRPGTLSD